ncbi:hypothetical protein niasHS_000653 [Heterodera schachtii]|uniref:Uncharacterized protein n=1 Tax=Heterodera schachtii TaxID=97005 RepID=A0ABD2K520_HETSC
MSDEQSIRRCITNLCSNLDPALINALLDDDQLLTDFQIDNDTLLFPIVKAFRQLYAQLKEELSCALSGQIGNEPKAFSLLSIFEKQQKEKSDDKLKKEKEMPNSTGKEKALNECADSIEVISLKEQKTSERNVHRMKTDVANTTRKNVLEFQFIDAFSLGKEKYCEFVDRSVQVESDLDFVNLKVEGIEKEDENLIESVSAASIYNGKESSFSTTANSTNSTEMSVGEVNGRKVARVLATRSGIDVYSADAEGAFLTFAQRRKPQKKCGATSNKCNHSLAEERRIVITSRRQSPQAEDDELVEVLSAKTLTEERRAHSGGGQKSGKNGQRKGRNEEEDEEQSTLNQVTPIPTTLELSNST